MISKIKVLFGYFFFNTKCIRVNGWFYKKILPITNVKGDVYRKKISMKLQFKMDETVGNAKN